MRDGNMKLHDVEKLSCEERFLYWIEERHAIYERRRRGQSKPWTDDEVLQRYFFTNPYRENDKVTRWFREHVREPLRNGRDVVFATVCFRWFNWIPTGRLLLYERLLTEWEEDTAIQVLSEYRSAGNKVFTGAFNISNSGSTKPKIVRVCQDYIEPVWQDRYKLVKDLERCRTMQAAHQRLTGYLGMGGSGFMSYEVVCDLRYTYLLDTAKDRMVWCNPGPGCVRGLNRLLGNGPSRVKPAHMLETMHDLLTEARKLKRMPHMEMREIEHSLCEFDKYERARLKDGHVKRRYAGGE